MLWFTHARIKHGERLNILSLQSAMDFSLRLVRRRSSLRSIILSTSSILDIGGSAFGASSSDPPGERACLRTFYSYTILSKRPSGGEGVSLGHLFLGGSLLRPQPMGKKINPPPPPLPMCGCRLATIFLLLVLPLAPTHIVYYRALHLWSKVSMFIAVFNLPVCFVP